MQTDDSNEPKIVGFESKPIPTSNANEIRTFALIGVGILFVIVVFFLMPSGQSLNDKANPNKNKTKYVAPKRGKSYNSAEEALREVQANIDRTMKQNQEMLDSIRGPKNRPAW